MRATRLLPLLALVLTAPLDAQGFAVPVRCAAACPPGVIGADSLLVHGTLEDGEATIYADFDFRSGADAPAGHAFFVRVPTGATVVRAWVQSGTRVVSYNEWSEPAEARRLLEEMARDRPALRQLASGGAAWVHVAVPALPAGAPVNVQVAYTQPLLEAAGTFTFRYPFAAGPAAARAEWAAVRLTVETEAGFRDLSSPSHVIRWRLGTELARCPPTHRCGSRGVRTHRIRAVFFEGGRGDQARDFTLRFTPGAQDPETAPAEGR